MGVITPSGYSDGVVLPCVLYAYTQGTQMGGITLCLVFTDPGYSDGVI